PARVLNRIRVGDPTSEYWRPRSRSSRPAPVDAQCECSIPDAFDPLHLMAVHASGPTTKNACGVGNANRGLRFAGSYDDTATRIVDFAARCRTLVHRSEAESASHRVADR